MNKHVKDAASGGNKRKREDDEKGKEKKPFDKKKYRLQKYSNKYKVNQWEERRKKAILRSYYKDLNKSERESAKKSGLKNAEENDNSDKPNPPKTMSAFYKAKQEFLRKQDEKRNKKEHILRTKLEREEALKKYKQKKMETYKKLSRKTKKGQPVMKDRMEMLLEKIQREVCS